MGAPNLGPMIHFCGVSKRVPDAKKGARLVLRDVTVSLPGDAYVALLGEDQQALTTTLHLLAGSEVPDRGRIIADPRRRSPIINAGNVPGSSLMLGLSGLENIRFFARIHGVDPGHLFALVESACRLEKLLYAPVQDYEGPARRALEITLIAALPYECYFLDGLEKFEQRWIWQLAHTARRRRAGLFFTTRKMPWLGQAGAVVEHGTIRVFHRTNRTIAGHEQRRQQQTRS
jgi:capsular polysaccharide transport system ATP-binding protein